MQREKEMERIKLDNIKEREQAKMRHDNNYRNSSANVVANQQLQMNQGSMSDKRKKKQKKIQEEYSMYEEEEKGDEDDELEDIIEEAQEEDSDQSDYQGTNRKDKKKGR